jgi:hypothetical protein
LKGGSPYGRIGDVDAWPDRRCPLRLRSFADGRVSFRYNDYAHAAKKRLMTMPAEEFLRRFTMHVLPRNFQRIRQYGLLANCPRRSQLERCRHLLGDAAERTDGELGSTTPTALLPPSRSCSVCGSIRLVRIREIEKLRRTDMAIAPKPTDTS